MRKYQVDFSVNGMRSSQIVSADTAMAARRIVEMQYTNCRLVFWGIKELTNK